MSERISERPYREVTIELTTEHTMIQRARAGTDLPTDRIVATVTDNARYAAKPDGHQGGIDGNKILSEVARATAYRFLRTVAYPKVNAVVHARIDDDLYGLLKARKFTEARALAEEKFPDPDNNPAHAFVHGLCADALCRYGDAARFYEIAYASDPDNEDYVEAVSRMDTILGEGMP
jgi:hypothetical protein